MRRVVRASAVRCFTKQIRTNFTDVTIKPRLATEFNGLVLPTQQELRDNVPEDSPSRRAHDRTIEQRRKARLAREAAMTPKAQRDPTTNSTDFALNALDFTKQRENGAAEDSSSGPTSGTVTRLRDPTLEQRREARLARESANVVVKPRLASEFNGLVLPSQEDRQHEQRQPQQGPPWDARGVTGRSQSVSEPFEGEYGGRPTRFGRRHRSERLERLDVLGEFTVDTKKPKPKFNKRRDQGSASAPSRTMARAKYRSQNSRSAVAAQSSLTDSLLDDTEDYDCLLPDNEDEGDEVEAYEEVEDYDEDEEYEEDEEDFSAEFNDPEYLSEDLADVFGPKLTTEIAGAIKIRSMRGTSALMRRTSALMRRRKHYTFETLCGDYMRHLPDPADVSLASPERNDAVTQVRLVLSKLKTIDLAQKQTLSGIVHSSIRKRSKALRRV